AQTKGLTKPSQIAGPPSTVTWLATPSSAARASIAPRSAALTPPVSANTVCTVQPRPSSHGTQKLVSSPPGNASPMAFDSGAAFMSGFSGNRLQSPAIACRSSYSRDRTRQLQLQLQEQL